MSLLPQTPAPGEIYLDHLAHFVPDMGAAEAALARLGFTLTPFTAQNNRTPQGLVPAGTGNRCAMLRNGYLEFLTATSDTPLAQRLYAALSRYTGVHLLAMTVADADEAAARLAEAGFAPEPPVSLTRAVPLPGGGSDEARFTVIRVPPASMPEGRIQILAHHSEEIVWQERWMAHRNRVVSLEAALLVVADPDEAAQRFARFLDRPVRKLDASRRIISLERGSLVFAPDAGDLAPGAPPSLPWIAAHALGSDDPAVTASIFAEGGCEPLGGEGAASFRLPPELGGFVTIVRPGKKPFWIT